MSQPKKRSTATNIPVGFEFSDVAIETAMYRYKTLTSGTLSLRCFNSQISKALANVKILNKMTGIGLPEKR